jgi:carbonic anhydrase/acetyltransferase-like protein (isoleucine patch superfamily)
MSVYEFENKTPKVGKGSFVFDTADVIGDVVLGENCYVGPGARIRGDYGAIRIGDNSAVEENAVIHARPDDITTIGNYVTIGHGSVIHNATIRDWAVIGMGAIVSDWSVIGNWAVVAEGAVVKNKQSVPDRNVAVGVPAKIISEISLEYEKQWTEFKNIYRDLARKRYPNSLKKIG